MKKLIVLMTAMALALGLTACGKSEAEIQKEKQAETVKKFYNAPSVKGGV